MHNERKFDIQYLKMAQIWATNSYCENAKVGCLIVNNGMIISDGFNGTPSGYPNVCENNDGKTFSFVIHAEANAISKLAGSSNSSKGATIYCTLSPCIECAKLIVQSGIKRVVYIEQFKRTEGLDLLNNVGVEVEQIKL